MGRKKKEIRLKEPVRIRENKIAGGNISLYLDIYQKGLRKKETLKLYRRSGSERMDGGSRNNQAYNLPLLTAYDSIVGYLSRSRHISSEGCFGTWKHHFNRSLCKSGS